MNMTMIAASAGQGGNLGLPSQEGMMLSFFLIVAGFMLLSAAALLIRNGNATPVLRYTRVRRDLNNF